MAGSAETKMLGCMFGMVGIVVLLPLWYLMMYAVLDSAQVPTWCWVVFWIHVPLNIVWQLGAKFIEAINSD